ncbi:MAG TPA: hypothetical protein VG722_06415, partial [Tepidisphaeraceae bacterium]|nr:hypothetical protein [Tepidisphaeraceae bacterium]
YRTFSSYGMYFNFPGYWIGPHQRAGFESGSLADWTLPRPWISPNFVDLNATQGYAARCLSPSGYDGQTDWAMNLDAFTNAVPYFCSSEDVCVD